MTRKEQIDKAIEEYLKLKNDMKDSDDLRACGFYAGTKWSDENPIIKLDDLNEVAIKYWKAIEMLNIAIVALEAIYNNGESRDNWNLQDYEVAMRHDEHEVDYALKEIEKLKKEIK